jgi:hypothetical protein
LKFIKGPWNLKFVWGKFLWPIFFKLCFRECEGMKNHNFNAI